MLNKYKHIVKTRRWISKNKPIKWVCIYNPQAIYKDYLKRFPDTKMILYTLMWRLYRGWSIERTLNTPYLGHGGARNFKSNKKSWK